MSDRRERETVVNVEREPPRNTTVYREGGSGTSVLVGLLIAVLVIVILAVFFWPTSEPGPGTADGDTNVTIEAPSETPPPLAPPVDEPTAPAPTQSAPTAEPPVTEPAPAPPAPSEPAPPESAPAPAPAQ